MNFLMDTPLSLLLLETFVGNFCWKHKTHTHNLQGVDNGCGKLCSNESCCWYYMFGLFLPIPIIFAIIFWPIAVVVAGECFPKMIVLVSTMK